MSPRRRAHSEKEKAHPEPGIFASVAYTRALCPSGARFGNVKYPNVARRTQENEKAHPVPGVCAEVAHTRALQKHIQNYRKCSRFKKHETVERQLYTFLANRQVSNICCTCSFGDKSITNHRKKQQAIF